jgi:prepilin peptidase CpaA
MGRGSQLASKSINQFGSGKRLSYYEAMNSHLILGVDALLVALLAAAIDVRQRRIPNWLTYPAIGMGVVLRSAFFGWRGLGTALAGCFFAGGIVLVFYAVRAMGAGDVKLLAALGSLLGFHGVIPVLLATAIAGGILALIYAIVRRRVGSTFRNVGSVMLYHSGRGLQAHPEVNLDNPSALRMPYGLAIATGTVYAFVMNWWR